jgi:hypothetical protein
MILPLLASTTLKKAPHNVVLPLPVRPTTPIFSPGLTVKEIPWRTSGELGEYRIWRLSTTIPAAEEEDEEDGQYAGGRDSGMIAGASCSVARYSLIRSMELKSNSSRASALQNQKANQREKYQQVKNVRY